MDDVLLEVKDLKVYYPVKTKSVIPHKEYVKAVDGVSFQVHRKEAFGIVGESGCGKSTTGHAIVGLLRPTSGEILFEGKSVVGSTARDFQDRAKKMQIIFQEPYSGWALHPGTSGCAEDRHSRRARRPGGGTDAGGRPEPRAADPVSP